MVTGEVAVLGVRTETQAILVCAGQSLPDAGAVWPSVRVAPDPSWADEGCRVSPEPSCLGHPGACLLSSRTGFCRRPMTAREAVGGAGPAAPGRPGAFAIPRAKPLGAEGGDAAPRAPIGRAHPAWVPGTRRPQHSDQGRSGQAVAGPPRHGERCFLGGCTALRAQVTARLASALGGVRGRRPWFRAWSGVSSQQLPPGPSWLLASSLLVLFSEPRGLQGRQGWRGLVRLVPLVSGWGAPATGDRTRSVRGPQAQVSGRVRVRRAETGR